jgi:hypothetical protein
LVPTAHLRCPQFGDHSGVQQFWERLWVARLSIFRNLFPWVVETIKELAGLLPDAKIGAEDHQANVAYLAAYAEYENGYRSDRPEVRAIHDRQNAEWKALTGLPPLGSVEDWRKAAVAAGLGAFDFEKATAVDFERVADCIEAWAMARQANATPPVATAPSRSKHEGKAEITAKKRRGRKPHTDPKEDKRIAEAWATKQYKTHEDLGREFGKTRCEIYRALDRHRKR